MVQINKQRRWGPKTAVLICGLAMGILAPFVSSCLALLNFLVLLVVTFLLYVSTGMIKCVTLPYLYFFYHLMLIHLGGILSKEPHPSFLLALCVGLLSFVIGIMLANFLFRFNPRYETRQFLQSPVLDGPTGIRFHTGFSLLAALALLVSVYYLYKVEHIPLLTMLRDIGNYAEITRQRVKATATLFGSGIFFQFYANLLPFITMVAVGKALKHKRWSWQIIATFLMFVTSFLLLASTRRAPFVMFCAYLLTFYFYYRGRIEFKKLAVLLLVNFLVLLAITSLESGLHQAGSTPRERLAAMLEPIYNRVLFVQMEPNRAVFDLIPGRYDFWGGRTYQMEIEGLRPGPGWVFSAWLRKELHPEKYKGRTHPVAAIVEFYVNFGFGGIICGMLLTGLFMQTVQIAIFRSRKTVLNLALGAFLVTSIARLAFGTLISTFTYYGPITVGLAYLGLMVVYAFLDLG